MKRNGFVLVDTVVALMILAIAATLVTKAISSSVTHLSGAEESLAKERIKRNYRALSSRMDLLTAENLSAKKAQLHRNNKGLYLNFLGEDSNISSVALEVHK